MESSFLKFFTLIFTPILTLSLGSVSQLFAEKEVSSTDLSLHLTTISNPSLDEISNNMDISLCGDRVTKKTFRKQANGDLSGALVWIDSSNFRWTPNATPPLEIRIERCKIHPRVVIVRPKQEVFFANGDPISYDLQFESQSNGVRSRPLPPNLKRTTISFEDSDFVKVRCLLHPHVIGYLMVQAHPYYGITDDNGRVKFSNFPPGSYRLGIWHEALGLKKTAEISLPAGSNKIEIKWEEITSQ